MCEFILNEKLTIKSTQALKNRKKKNIKLPMQKKMIVLNISRIKK